MGRNKEHDCPSGIEIRRSAAGVTSLRILFYYRGVLCRESLLLKATAANIQHAARRRAVVLDAIERNKFNYADFFPESKNARRFGHVAEQVLIKDMLDTLLNDKAKTLARSSFIRYKRKCVTHMYPVFGNIFLQNLTSETINDWLKTLTCQRKTITSILEPLRVIIRRGLTNKYIATDPLKQVDIGEFLTKKQRKSRFIIDPFNRDEINAILAVIDGQAKNLYQFAFFTGLRPSELIGLRWKDVNFMQGTFEIEETIVDKEKADPKTEAGFRTVLLLPPALQALMAQKEYTFGKSEHVFHNPRTNTSWETSQQLRRTVWIPALKRAEVRYRNPYQTRHTYASMLISQGENIVWVSKQMGHSDVHVTLKRYTDWVPDTRAKAGYQPQNNWGEYLAGRNGSVKVCDVPQAFTRRHELRVSIN